MKISAIMLALAASAPCAFASPEAPADTVAAGDEVKIRDLKEIVVEGERAWFEGNKAVFVPARNEKNLAKDAVSLIENMGTALLYVKEGKIYSRTESQPVAIYINGQPATDADLATFWPKNALRVEYMRNTDDPKFMGAMNVVNFVMKEYVVGGVTRLSGYQTFPNQGDYSAASKLVYKKMSYNAVVKGGYARDHRSGSYSRETYEDVWYGGEHYDAIEREEKYLDNASRQDRMGVAFNALYNSGKSFVASHNASFSWSRDPGSYSSGSVQFSPAVIAGDRLRRSTSGRTIGASISGRYSFRPADKVNLMFNWGYNHARNNGFSQIAEGEATPIANGTKENTNGGQITATVYWQINDRMNLQGSVSESRNWYSTLYSGSADSKQWQQRGLTTASLYWYWQATPSFSLVVYPTLSFSDWNVNHNIKHTELLGGANVYGSYTINRKNSLNANVYFSAQPVRAALVNDLILRESELTWIAGNPSLGSYNHYGASLNYTLMPAGWFDLNADVSWILRRNWDYFNYTAGGMDYDGVIKQYIGGNNQIEYTARCDVNFRLFDRKLRLMGGLEFSREIIAGTGRKHTNRRPELRANFYAGNFMVGATYYFKDKIMSANGTELISRPGTLWVMASYGNGNLNVDLSLQDIFTNHAVRKTTLACGPFRSLTDSWSGGRSVSVSLTYTFDYGRKVNPDISANVAGPGESSVLGK